MIIVYSTSGCHACQVVKTWLINNNQEFEMVDISKLSTQEQLELNQKTGHLAVPIIKMGEKYFYSLGELKKELSIFDDRSRHV